VKPNGMTWWRLPENREWYHYISMWLYSGFLLIAIWSLCIYAVWYFTYADRVDSRVEGWAYLYRIWAITCLAGILFLSISFLVMGLRKYRELKLNIILPTSIGLLALPFFACVLWLGTVFFFHRQRYEPDISLSLFDASWMIGLLSTSFSIVHFGINWIARVFFSRRDKADV